MALVASALSKAAFAQYLIYNPLAAAAIRSNAMAAPPILPHCVPAAMLDGIAAGLATGLKTLTVGDMFSGTAGPPGVAAPVPFVLNPGIMSGARAAFMASMVWGPTAVPAATALVDGVMTALMGLTQIQMGPPPGMGAGAGVISAASLSAVGFPAACTAALNSALPAGIASTAKFNVLDVAAGPPTPQILLMMTNLATAYTTCLSGMTAAVVYAGAATPTGIGGVNTGKFL